MEVGFLYLKNVGEPETMFQEVINQGKAFFDIPTEEKYVLPVSVTAPGSDLTSLINLRVLTSQG
jgi:isopenicillin N synthase-like dioxygenase